VRSQKKCFDKQSETCQNIYSLNDFPQIRKYPKPRKSHNRVENWSIYTQNVHKLVWFWLFMIFRQAGGVLWDLGKKFSTNNPRLVKTFIASMTSHKFENILNLENYIFESKIGQYILKCTQINVILTFHGFYTSRRCFVRSRKKILDEQSETCQNIYSPEKLSKQSKNHKTPKHTSWVRIEWFCVSCATFLIFVIWHKQESFCEISEKISRQTNWDLSKHF